MWGEPVEIVSATEIWRRTHVLRLTTRGGRRAVLKRPRPADDPEQAEMLRRAFLGEWAALEHVNAMPDAPAPKLLGGDVDLGFFVMDDLPPGHSLADSLLGRDDGEARRDLIAYARSLASLHAWSIGRETDFDAIRERLGLPSGPRLWGARMVERGVAPLVEVAKRLGIDASGVTDEAASAVVAIDEGATWRGLVHGDPCPDNTRIIGDSCVIFDFQPSSYGSIVLDASYLAAPFPTCWCFAQLPQDISDQALAAYRAALDDRGISTDGGWNDAIAAALASLIVARGPAFAHALDDDDAWGTTTMRPRLIQWLESFLGAARKTDQFVVLAALARSLRDALAERWGEIAVGEYPALARSKSHAVAAPEWWEPGL